MSCLIFCMVYVIHVFVFYIVILGGMKNMLYVDVNSSNLHSMEYERITDEYSVIYWISSRNVRDMCVIFLLMIELSLFRELLSRKYQAMVIPAPMRSLMQWNFRIKLQTEVLRWPQP